MKKSYFAIGAIAATMCSCSSESIPSAGEGNVLPGTEDLSPISLSMTGKQTTVEVGSRTRGTGNVGGTNGTTWQNEKLYILMTSSDPDCLVGEDIDAEDPVNNSWGFTNLDGEGPWLREQFNGAIWARPQRDAESSVWDLVYNHEYNLGNNDWYQGAGVYRYYPINGASDFFAYHIDDAAAAAENLVENLPDNYFYKASSPGGAYKYPAQPLDEPYPIITRNDDNTEMTVNFKIDGSQDLLAGKAERDARYPLGFSAKSARHNVVPKISMKHLLSRLTFTIYRGDEMAKNIQITGITIKKVRNQGRMIVAYKQNPSNSSLIQWKRPGANAESPDDDTYDEGALELDQTYYRTDFKLMQSPANILGDPAPETDALTSIKNNLAPLAPFNVSGITNWLQPNKTGDNYYKTIGSPMFVAPGETEYEMTLDYKVLVRDNGNGVFDDPVFGEDGSLTSGDLIEKMQVTYTLKAPVNAEDNNTFAQGKSYNIKITVYGLQPITATVELTPWTEAGDVWIGGDNEDNTPENLPNPNPGQGQNPGEETNPDQGEGTDPGQGEGNDQGQGGENGQGQGPNPGGNENPGGEAEPAA